MEDDDENEDEEDEDEDEECERQQIEKTTLPIDPSFTSLLASSSEADAAARVKCRDIFHGCSNIVQQCTKLPFMLLNCKQTCGLCDRGEVHDEL